MRHGRPALFLLCTAAFMAVADMTIVSIALPSMRRELEFSGADAQWILGGYALAFGGLLLLCGRAGDLYGRRRLFLAGLAVFGGARAGVALAADDSVRRGRRTHRAVGVYGAMAALGFVVGMVGEA